MPFLKIIYCQYIMYTLPLTHQLQVRANVLWGYSTIVTYHHWQNANRGPFQSYANNQVLYAQ